MGTVELKKKLVAEINLSSNKELLEEMYRLLNQDNEAGVFKLSQSQKKAVTEAREQVRNGQFFTDEQVNDEMEEWLKGK
ncbi:hypothetical protein J0A68_17755 [Algoriphagus sp. H41]|uniref:Uncharacterized protein n=1 Tax=Algoriphagus oliviformis TaxID=2811231 RepID=A0ABS3C7J7_9BACT|nr:hypothetical protein [Algoriphagus oliviformis]MBN7812805.1 hypothetical protein [Algoriphagus oliviformis]